jgi:predicted ATPase with chaperone activity
MSEKDEEYKERFETVEQALKYIADSQAKSEFVRKKEQVEFTRRQNEFDKWLVEMNQLQASTQRHLDHITKVVRFLADDNEDKNKKIEKVGVVLSQK